MAGRAWHPWAVVVTVVVAGLVGAGLWWTGSGDGSVRPVPVTPGATTPTASPTVLAPPFTALLVRSGDAVDVISLPDGARHAVALPAGAREVQALEPATAGGGLGPVRVVGIAGSAGKAQAFVVDVGSAAAASPSPVVQAAAAHVLAVGRSLAVVSGTSPRTLNVIPSELATAGTGAPIPVPEGWNVSGLAAPAASIDGGIDGGGIDAVLTRQAPGRPAGIVQLARWYPTGEPLPIAPAAQLLAVGRAGQAVWLDPGCPNATAPARPLGGGGCALHMSLPSGPQGTPGAASAGTPEAGHHIATAPEGVRFLAGPAAVGSRGVVASFAAVLTSPATQVAVLSDPEGATARVISGSGGAVPAAGVVWSARGDAVFVVRGDDGRLHPAFLAPGATRARVLDVTLAPGTTLLAVRGGPQ